MNRARSLAVLVAGLVFPAWAEAADPAKPPNIILVITDDQGYGDVAQHGNPVVRTPNLDRLHDESVRFLDHYVSPTCAPTRASLLTGRHEFKNGVTHTIHERERLTLQATTLTQVLQSAGYATGIFGKWHLGDEPAYQPGKRGFDEVFIHGAGGIGQSYPGSCGDAPKNSYFNPAILHNGTFEKTTGYCTDVFFHRAEAWIQKTKGKQPFFAYIATNAPHAPLNVPEKYEAMYKGQPANVAKFFGMITNIDDNIGRLIENLKTWQIEKDTLLIFMNDNGGTAGVPVFNAGMRGSKNTPYRGGTRGAAFFRWQGILKPANVDRITAHLDLFPTLAELAGAKLPAHLKLDGISLVPLLKNPEAAWPDRTLFTHQGRWPAGQAADAKFANCSIRRGNYSLVSSLPKPSGKPQPKAGPQPNWELYDLKSDPGEKTNLAAEKPAIVKAMAAAYDEWWAGVLPLMVNEEAYKTAPRINPYRELYLKQFPAP